MTVEAGGARRTPTNGQAGGERSVDSAMTDLGERYAIERVLGRGGMGTVYLARDRQLDRPVALKVLTGEFATRADLRERFLRETRLAAGFSHPNVVPVFAVEDREDVLAFAMAYVEGESLDERVRRAGPLGVRDVVRVLQDVAYGLAYAHGRGVVQRDIKPENIMLERATGRALLMDFGVARAITATPLSAPGLTRIGEVVGTPEFMSPEQAAGDEMDGRSDLYSLGLVAWFAATGRLAISGDTTQRILVRQLTETVPSVRTARDDLPAPLAAAIDRLLCKEPDERFPNAEALVEAIDLAQLAPPTVPLAVRLFQQEGRSYIENAFAVVLIAAAMLRWPSPAQGLAALVIVSVAVALEFVLLVSIGREARTLRQQGFDHTQLRTGLRVILAEGDDARAQSRMVPGVARKRRLRQAGLPILFLLGVYNLYNGLGKRVRTPSGPPEISSVGAALVVTGLCSIVIAVALWAINPHRRPWSQRAANAFWSGRVGAWLMGAPRARQPHDARTTAVAGARPAASHMSPPGDDRLASIEARLASLERRMTERL